MSKEMLALQGKALDIAKELRKAREKVNKSQRDVSVFLGYGSPQFVSNWERAIALPPLKDLKKICKFLNTDFYFFAQRIVEYKRDETVYNTRRDVGLC